MWEALSGSIYKEKDYFSVPKNEEQSDHLTINIHKTKFLVWLVWKYNRTTYMKKTEVGRTELLVYGF